MPSSRLTTTCRCRRRLAVGPKGDVPEEGDDLDLLGDRNFPVVLRLPIEETEDRAAARADAGELGGRDAVLAGEALNAANGLVALVQHQDVGFLPPIVDELRLHNLSSRPPRLRGTASPILCDHTAATLQFGRPRVAPETFQMP